jgi:cellulose synthase/poly-beta-1,6-N-acetylglucosamine synthase-like glycosyltransferase
MHIAAIILIVLTTLVLLVWFSRHLMLNVQHKSAAALGEDYPVGNGPWPLLSVVVAAKDEQDNIERCVRTMLTQDYPNFEMLVANDRSTDHTREIVEGIAAADRRLRVINITHLPEGWCGKNNAMQTAIAQSKGEYVCMIDADCRQISARTLTLAMQYALDHKSDLLSVLPTLEMKGFWENVIQPVCGGIMIIWFHPDKVNDPAKPHAYANGAFMLIRRDAYEKIGTHEAVKHQVNEDMHMALNLKRAGLALRVAQNRSLFVTRMYNGLGQTLRGWSRIFYGTFGTFRRLMVSLGVLTVMGLLPYLAAVLGLVGVGGSGGSGGAPVYVCLAAAGLAAAAMQLTVIYRFYKYIGAQRNLAWTYPLGCAMGIYVLIQSLMKLRKGAKIIWRSTAYSRPTT